MVRLLLGRWQVPLRRLTCFNPTMVRLLPVIQKWVDAANSRFQSHNGAIAAVLRLTLDNFTLFQSHNGAIAAEEQLEVLHIFAEVSIPQWCDCCQGQYERTNTAIARFNPTMVRLLPGY